VQGHHYNLVELFYMPGLWGVVATCHDLKMDLWQQQHEDAVDGAATPQKV